MSFRARTRDLLYRYFPRVTFYLHAWSYWKRAVEREIRLLPQLCSIDKISIDIGAHYGIYSYFMLRHSAKVISFEPNPVLAGQLRTIFGSQVKIVETAVSSKTATAKLKVPRNLGESLTALASIERDEARHLTEQYDSIVVSTTRLDDLLPIMPRIGFIKIDVEGHELDVLKGGAELLMRDKPCLLIEVEEQHRANAVSSVWNFLQQFKYEGYFIDTNRLVSIREFINAKHQCVDAPHDHPYINNFIFVSGSELLHRLDLLIKSL